MGFSYIQDTVRYSIIPAISQSNNEAFDSKFTSPALKIAQLLIFHIVNSYSTSVRDNVC